MIILFFRKPKTNHAKQKTSSEDITKQKTYHRTTEDITKQKTSPSGRTKDITEQKASQSRRHHRAKDTTNQKTSRRFGSS